MKDLKNTLGRFFSINGSQRILLVDRAFLGLYAIFTLLKRNTGKSKVLFTSNTCASPVYACIYAGMTPLFTDISLEDYLMDSDETLEIIYKYKYDLAAVVYIYIFGHTSNAILSIKKITQQYGIALIEDVAQAFGSKVGNYKTGTIGDISVFSFGYSKHIDTGSGGFILNNDPFKFDITEINTIISNSKQFENNMELSLDYNTKFYNLRKEALQNPAMFISYHNFHKRFIGLYFNKLKPDWYKIEKKIREFISDDLCTKRNDIAKRYYEGLKKEKLDIHVYSPIVKDGYSVYRYSILVDNYTISQELSDSFRANNIHCSNLYLPVSRFFFDTGFDRSIEFSRRVINLWVDSTVDNAYIKKTLQLIEQYFIQVQNSNYYTTNT